MTELSYTVRPNLLVKERTYRLSDDALTWQDADGSGRLAFAGVRQVRLSTDPSFGKDRSRCILLDREGHKLKLELQALQGARHLGGPVEHVHTIRARTSAASGRGRAPCKLRRRQHGSLGRLGRADGRLRHRHPRVDDGGSGRRLAWRRGDRRAHTADSARARHVAGDAAWTRDDLRSRSSSPRAAGRDEGSLTGPRALANVANTMYQAVRADPTTSGEGKKKGRLAGSPHSISQK